MFALGRSIGIPWTFRIPHHLARKISKRKNRKDKRMKEGRVIDASDKVC
jgi:hypothetical protein